METVLITGAGGYIGSVLTGKLLSGDYRVIAVDRYYFGRDKLTPQDNLKVVVEDSRKLTPQHFEGVDYVVDLVSISNDPSAELFSRQTMEINFESRARTALLARDSQVKRYILPSSASIYGYQDEIVNEDSPTNPLTVYARANEMAEKEVLKLSSETFVVTVIRQATVFGYSPRMRFDLAINGMTYGAWRNGKLPLMRDGTQFRPMVHIQDTTDVIRLLLTADTSAINGEIFNVGAPENNFQIGPLAERIADVVSKRSGHPVNIEWYGHADVRSYRLDFSKIQNRLGWNAKWTAEQGVAEIMDFLESGRLERTPQTITLDWYRDLEYWHKVIKEVEKYGGILDIKGDQQ